MLIYFLICLGASVIGAICGIGGGVIIKPLLDLLHVADVKTISFLSGCTVLCMSAYSVVRSRISDGRQPGGASGTAIAIGGALGGVIGKLTFNALTASLPQNTVGGVQAACLLLLTIGTLTYSLCQRHIQTRNVCGVWSSVLIGTCLGIFSSFLGIGGGPINLLVLSYFYSMDTKTAARTSLYIILVSQLASLLLSVLTAQIPDFSLLLLFVMAAGGIGGGILGRLINKRINGEAVRVLYCIANVLIILICIWNLAGSLHIM